MKTNHTFFFRKSPKQILATALCVSGLMLGGTLLANNVAWAADGGFSERNTQASKHSHNFADYALSTVAEAKAMRDDTKVMLRGQIIQHVDGNNYLLRDATDTIRVKIKDRKWQGQVVTPEDVVELYGEVDKDRKGVEIDVDRIAKITVK
ncbi:MAG: NirD/YgiW/YdeI family stress tolerance protein [Burkholderiales bacterium]|jgi:uncharacterized protein (TIGR00156 family)|nr:NirD/YgiW/YdeI family stress tolerance protein [Burkholderiales bacterium]